MLKALAWKEWREQRPLMLTGMALCVAMPFFLAAGMSVVETRQGFRGLAEMLSLTLALVIWPLFAAAAGATTISTEIDDGTLRFLLSRPVSRRAVWAIKVLMASVSAFAVVAFSLLVVEAFNFWAFGGVDVERFSLDRVLRHFGPSPFDLVNVASVSLLLFACAVFFSTFLAGPLTAAAAGLALSLTILTGIFVLWSRFSLVPRFEPQWLATAIALTALLILMASLVLFARAELFRASLHFSTAVVARGRRGAR
ncbi:MAG: ABC transporter permease subunit, partial [Acidobacteriota bacterium]